MMKFNSNQRGFTLIEMMIAITLFVVIMILGAGAILRTNVTHKKTQAMRSAMDNLSFAIEDMARNLRLGSSYRCPAGIANINSSPIADGSPSDCQNSSLTIAFDSVSPNPDPAITADQFIYAIGPNRADPNKYSIYKSKDGGFRFLQMTPDEIEIDPAKSGFTVLGSAPGPSNTDEPRVIIRLSGKVKVKDTESNFNIQTTVSERSLDR